MEESPYQGHAARFLLMPSTKEADADVEKDVAKKFEDFVSFVRDASVMSNQFSSAEVQAQVIAAYLAYKSGIRMVKWTQRLAIGTIILALGTFVLAVVTLFK